MKSIIENAKNCLWNDQYNRYFVLFSIVAGVIEYLVWTQKIVAGSIFVYTRLTYFPVQLFLLVFVLHILLSVYSYEKDKHISHLLLGALPVFAIFILILEIFYIYGNI